MAQSKDVEPRFRKKNTRNWSLCRSLISGWRSGEICWKGGGISVKNVENCENLDDEFDEGSEAKPAVFCDIVGSRECLLGTRLGWE